jgi:hypothetical protein
VASVVLRENVASGVSAAKRVLVATKVIKVIKATKVLAESRRRRK